MVQSGFPLLVVGVLATSAAAARTRAMEFEFVGESDHAAVVAVDEKESGHEAAATVEHESKRETVVAERGCNALTCTVADGTSCHCKDVQDKVGLSKRIQDILFDLMQNLRYLSDKLKPESGSFSKLWHSRGIKAAEGNLAVLDWALDSGVGLSDGQFEDIEGTPVKDIGAQELALPAGVMPLMFEIWDAGVVVNSFVGESGAPLALGTNDYSKPLQNNRYRSTPREAALGTVSFQTTVTRGPVKECADDTSMHCVEIKLLAKCLSATDLVNTDTGIAGDFTDPYCKIRVKKDATGTSSKHKTDYVKDNLNPTFSPKEVYYQWEIPVIIPAKGPDETPVPWTMEELTVPEQAHAALWYIAKEVFGKDCKTGDINSATCEAVDKFGQLNVDDDTLQLADGTITQNTELLASAKRAQASLAGEGVSLAEVTSGSGSRTGIGHGAAVHAGLRAARRRRRGGGRRGGGYRGGGGSGGGGGGFGVFILVIVMIALFASL